MDKIQSILGPMLGEGQAPEHREVARHGEPTVVSHPSDGSQMKALEGAASRGSAGELDVVVDSSTPKTHQELVAEEVKLASELAEQRHKERMKKVSLVLLTIQNCVVIVALKYSRTPAARDENGQLYITTTAVALGEVVKFVVSICIIVWGGGLQGLVDDVHSEMIEKPVECAKMIVPSLLYTVQNNLMYAAMYHISAAAFQCTMQLKILTTAVFSVLLLGKVLEPFRWGGLAVLMVGCIFVNLDQSSSSSSPPTPAPAAAPKPGGGANPVLGVLMTVTAACTSGLAGVYFEKLLKGAKTSLWIRQIQLSVGGMAIGFACVGLQDWDAVQEDGFFQGYTGFTWFLIFWSAAGGLVIAMVVKYSDNLYKAFAVSLSIIFSTLMSIPIFKFQVSLLFCIGASLVILSIFLYEKMVPFDAFTIVGLFMTMVAAGFMIKV